MSSTGARFIGVVAAAVLTSQAPPVEAQSRGLFTAVAQTVSRSLASTSPAALPSGPFADATLRSRLVTIDLGRIGRARVVAASRRTSSSADASADGEASAPLPEPGATLLLNLFDDVAVTGIVEWTDATFSGGYSVSGRLAGEPLGTMTLVVNDERVAGEVRTLDGTYRIRSVGAGLYSISEVEEPPLRCGVAGPHPETDDHRH
jgi:hypothetical protein